MQDEEKEKLSVNLPENAFRELKDGEKYEPILRPECQYPEVTPYSVSMGLITVSYTHLTLPTILLV